MKKVSRTVMFIIILLLAVGACFAASKLLTVSTIHVHGGSVIGLDELVGKPLFLLNESTISKDLLKKNPTIEKITFEKKYPNILSIRVQQSKPVGLLAVANGYYILSSSGKVIGKERTKMHKLPLITIGQKFPFQAYRVGETMSNQELLTSAYVLGKFTQNGVYIDTVEIRGFDVVVCKGAGHTYIFSASKDKAEQFSELMVVYRQFFVEGKKYQSIDVRFEKPVVVFNNDN